MIKSPEEGAGDLASMFTSMTRNNLGVIYSNQGKLDEARRELAQAASAPPPKAEIGGLMDLGRGVALRVRSDGLDLIRARLSEHFYGLLTAQDAGGWTPHVTVQNKAERGAVREAMRQLEPEAAPRPLAIREGSSRFTDSNRAVRKGRAFEMEGHLQWQRARVPNALFTLAAASNPGCRVAQSARASHVRQ